MTRRRRRHTPDQIIPKLAEGHTQLAAGVELAEVCRHLKIAESTWHRWLARYGGMKANDAKRLRDLEGENASIHPSSTTMSSGCVSSSVTSPGDGRWGRRRAAEDGRRAGWQVNDKRVRRCGALKA